MNIFTLSNKQQAPGHWRLICGEIWGFHRGLSTPPQEVVQRIAIDSVLSLRSYIGYVANDTLPQVSETLSIRV